MTTHYLKNRKKILEQRRVYRDTYPDKVRDSKRCSQYGLKPGQYETLLASQNGVCAICRQIETVIHPASKKVKPLTVDHDHASQKVRGLVCHKCNAVLGYTNDSALILRAAADYLEQSHV